MADTPEGKAKVKIRKWIKDNLPGAFRFAPRGGPFAVAGIPDEIICWLGVFIGLEIKSEVGEATAMQMVQLQAIQKAGGVACIVRGYDVARLEAMKQAALAIANGRTRQDV